MGLSVSQRTSLAYTSGILVAWSDAEGQKDVLFVFWLKTEYLPTRVSVLSDGDYGEPHCA